MFKKKFYPLFIPALILSMAIFTTGCDKEENDEDDDGMQSAFAVSDYVGTFIGKHAITILDAPAGIDPIDDTLIIADAGGSNQINITSAGLDLTFTGTINTSNGTVNLTPFESDSVNIVSTVDSMIWVTNVKATGVTSNTRLNADKTTVTTQLKVTGKAYGLNTVSDVLPSPFNITSGLDARLTGSFTKQ